MPLVYVTFDRTEFDYGLPDPNPLKSQDVVPGFMYLMGSVVYERDVNGNLVIRNRTPSE